MMVDSACPSSQSRSGFSGAKLSTCGAAVLYMYAPLKGYPHAFGFHPEHIDKLLLWCIGACAMDRVVFVSRCGVNEDGNGTT